MDRSTTRRVAQLVLAVIALLASTGAVYRYLRADAGFFGPRVVMTPAAGPVGMRPFLELSGFPGGREATVYLCPSADLPVAECVELAAAQPGRQVRSAVIPPSLPNGDELALGTYVLRAGPDEDGNHPVRGSFDVVPFALGPAADPTALRSLDPPAIGLGRSREVARMAPCRPPSFMPDGRLAVGSTVVDPETGVTIDLGFAAAELVWSPDGTTLAVLTGDSKEIRLSGPDGSDPVTQVREARGLLSSLTWSPDGSALAYISRDDPDARRGGPGPPTVQILDTATGQTRSAGPGLWVAWSAQDVLVVERINERLELSTPAGVRRDFIAGARPAWSAGGRLITAVRGADPSGEGWIALGDGSRATRVVASGVCGLAISPSGTSLAVTVIEGDETTLTLRSIERRT